MKSRLRKKAIELRKKGYSYSEILKEVSVAKSTLSLWLHSVGLAQTQKQKLTNKKLAAMKRGWESRRTTRLDKEQQIKRAARFEIPSISKENLWLMGIALYWAEGSKQKKTMYSKESVLVILIHS